MLIEQCNSADAPNLFQLLLLARGMAYACFRVRGCHELMQDAHSRRLFVRLHRFVAPIALRQGPEGTSAERGPGRPGRHRASRRMGHGFAAATLLGAIPGLSDTQVIIRTTFPGQAPRIVEDQVTYPLATTMMSVPGAKSTCRP